MDTGKHDVLLVIPAEAGIQVFRDREEEKDWTPAFAGVTCFFARLAV